MIKRGFCSSSSFGSNPSRSRTPGRKGSMRTSARQAPEASAGLSSFRSKAMPLGALSETAKDRLPLPDRNRSSQRWLRILRRKPKDIPGERVWREGGIRPVHPNDVCSEVGQDDCRDPPPLSCSVRLPAVQEKTHVQRMVQERGLPAARRSRSTKAGVQVGKSRLGWEADQPYLEHTDSGERSDVRLEHCRTRCAAECSKRSESSLRRRSKTRRQVRPWLLSARSPGW